MNRRVQIFALLVFGAIVAIVAHPVLAIPDLVYPLDAVERTVSPRGKVRCPKVELETYRGTSIRYRRPVKIYVGFKSHLAAFEEVVREVALEVYGRAPSRLVHMGAYNCRRIRSYPEFLSEHALGNALDVEGFDFKKASDQEPIPEGAPRWTKGPFKVRLLKHWKSKGRYAIHSRFLRTLAQRLINKPLIFRSLLGPAWPGHHNHFHFDMSPWRTVEIFEPEDEPSD